MSGKTLTLYELGVLQLIRQNKIEDLSNEIQFEASEDILSKFSTLGYIEYVKPKKKSDNVYKCVRTTSKGNAVLEDIETPEINEDDLKIFNWLEQIYLDAGKEIGNKKKTKMFIANFRVQSGIDKNSLAYLCQEFTNDESQYEWSQRLEYLFFKGASVFSVKFDINQSRLYQYYDRNKVKFDKQFEKLND